jgi:hypothetical protein
MTVTAFYSSLAPSHRIDRAAQKISLILAGTYFSIFPRVGVRFKKKLRQGVWMPLLASRAPYPGWAREPVIGANEHGLAGRVVTTEVAVEPTLNERSSHNGTVSNEPRLGATRVRSRSDRQPPQL